MVVDGDSDGGGSGGGGGGGGSGRSGSGVSTVCPNTFFSFQTRSHYVVPASMVPGWPKIHKDKPASAS